MSDHEERRTAEAAQAILNMSSGVDKPLVREHLQVLAKLRRAKYEAYVSVGFNPGQALYLCTQPMEGL